MQGHRSAIRVSPGVMVSSSRLCTLALPISCFLVMSGLALAEYATIDEDRPIPTTIHTGIVSPATRSGFDGTVWCLFEHEGSLISGGDFSMAGEVAVANVARWDGSAWFPLGSGANGVVYCLGEFDGDLIAGGEFTSAGGAAAANIARWDGTSWAPLGSGADGGVRALLDYQGTLVVGGDFTVAGGVSASKIAAWNGSQWSPLGQGFSGGYNSLGVRALAICDGQIVAGGFFTHSGSAYTNRIARWDGQGWRRLGAWTDDTIYTLLIYRDHLIAGSTVWNAGQGTWANLLRHWDGTTWGPMGNGSLDPPFPNAVRALAVYDQRIYAGGQFPRADGTVVNYIAEWNGRQWRPIHWFPVSSGMNGPVYALAPYGGFLFAGGEFTTAGGVPAGRIAAWDHHHWSEPVRAPLSVPVATDVEVAPEAYPNPFANRMVVQFSVSAPTPARLDVYDLAGRWVVRLVDGSVGVGTHSIVWDGSDHRGIVVPPGSYVYRLALGGIPQVGALLKKP